MNTVLYILKVYTLSDTVFQDVYNGIYKWNYIKILLSNFINDDCVTNVYLIT